MHNGGYFSNVISKRRHSKMMAAEMILHRLEKYSEYKPVKTEELL